MKYIRGTVSVVAGLLILVVVSLAMPSTSKEPQVQGVTYSAPYMQSFGVDPREGYEALFTDLHVPLVRLMAYWNVVEPEPGVFDFAELDYQMDTAAKYDARVILSIGRKLPRWPECHIPDWARELGVKEQQDKVIELLDVVVDRYKDHPALEMWQLENEPLLDFGTGCAPEDREFLQREFDFVNMKDTNIPVMITDSGELNSWLPAAKYGDIVGTTMYRTVFSKRTQRPFSYDYIFPAWAYRAKARLVKLVRGKDVIISELQGEPWGKSPIQEMNPEERAQSFSAERFGELHRFAERSGLPVAIWWGVEYWYWEKVDQGNPAFWDTAKEIFAQETVNDE